MPDITLISTAVQSIQSIADITKSLIGIRDTAMIETKLIEIRQNSLTAIDHAVNAKIQQAELLDEINNLKKQIANFDKWELEKEKYELKELKEGVFVYTTKDSNAEPKHYLCTNYFNQSYKSILQKEQIAIGRAEVLVCPKCKTEIYERGLKN